MARRTVQAGAAQLKVAQNQVRGSASPRAALSDARRLVPAADMQAFVDWLPTVRRAGRGISFDHYPRTIDQLWRTGTLARASLSKELAWAVAVFRGQARELDAFRVAAADFEVHLVEDRHAECAARLDAIEREFGVSLWVVETRMALLQRAEGLEAQKAYAAGLQAARGRHDVVSFLSYHLSRRNEPSTTPARYVQELEELVGRWDDAEGMGTFVLHRLGDRAPVGPAAYADVLRHEASGALVDHYEAFVGLAVAAAAVGDDLVRAAFAPHVALLAAAVKDRRTRRAAFLLTGDAAWLDGPDPAGASAEDALALGDRDAVEAIVRDMMRGAPADARNWRLAAAVPEGGGGPPDFSGDLRTLSVRRMRSLRGPADDVEVAIVALLRDALNHRLHGFSRVLRAAVVGEMLGIPSLSRWLEAQSFAHGAGLRPSDVGRVANAGARAVLAVAANCAPPGSRSAALAEALLRVDVDAARWEGLPAMAALELPDEVLVEAEIARSLERGDHGRVLELSDCVASSADEARRRRVSRLVSVSLLQAGRVVELAGLIARSCVADAALAGMLPLSECARLLDKRLRKEAAGELAVPIVLDLFSKRFDDSLDDVRSFAYEDFLIAHDLERPSQIDGRSDEFERPLLVHYLRHICVPGVMQVSSAFQGTRELEDERKKVLSLLVKLDPASAKHYEDELREVARTQLIHRGVRQVERSKIYVDVPPIRRAFEKKHRETFQRYQALRRAGIGMDDGELEAALEESRAGKPLPARMLEVPKNEVADLLLEMLRWLFDECSTSPEHGLDCYLSMRIRHGTLSGQLRTPLEVERIITQRTSDADEYGSNEHWLERLGHLDEACRAAVDERLARFSAEYDSFIGRIAQEMVQVQRPDRPAGLFRISLRSIRFRLWAAALRSEMTFDEFFDRSMEIFWESVENSLAEVRSVIDQSLKPEMNAMFAGLESDVRGLAGAATPDLDRAIRTARTGTLQALDLVKDWFRLSQPISEPPFPIGDLIDVGLQCVKAIHREFAPQVTRELDPLPPFAEALVLFSDIFFIIFDNVRRHSAAGSSPRVSIEVRDRGDQLSITARSEVSDGVATPEALERMDAIRRSVAEGDYGSAIRSEGGTGLIKLGKLIGRDKARAFNFGFDGDEFFVSFELTKREIER